jgi:hypothetical protein
MVDLPTRFQAALVLAFTLLLGGCASNPQVLEADRHDIKINFNPPNLVPGRFDEGIHVVEQAQPIRIKLRGKSLLSALDEIGYRLGLNYTVLSDLSPYSVSIHAGESKPDNWSKMEQRHFDLPQEVFDHIRDKINAEALIGSELRLAYQWKSDGPVFYLTKAGDKTPICSANTEITCSTQPYAFKKFFIHNITAMQAMESLWGVLPADFDVKHDQKGQTGELIFRAHNTDKSSSVVIYKPQNAIILRAAKPETFDIVSQLIGAIDASYQQVLVETIVFEYDDTTEKKIGAALDYKFGDKDSRNQFNFSSLFGERIGKSTNPGETILPNLYHTLTDTEKKFTLLTKLALYDRDGLVRILAQPRLLLQSGTSALVSMSSAKHILTTGINSPGELRVVDTKIELKVTPTVLGNGKILLDTAVTQSEFIPTSEANVATATNENKITTSLLVKDGEMSSIGGILIKRDSKFASGLPGLRQIPGLGLLFGSKTGDSSTTRIEFMIRPTVNLAKREIDAIQNDIQGLNDRLQDELRPKRNEEVIDMTVTNGQP